MYRRFSMDAQVTWVILLTRILTLPQNLDRLEVRFVGFVLKFLLREEVIKVFKTVNDRH